MQLNMEQKKLIQAKPNGHNLIRGVAGSGKTTVAVHRAEFILNHYCFQDDDRILLVTYNKTLVKYLKHLHQKVDAQAREQALSLFRVGEGEDNHDRVEISTVDSLVHQYFRERVPFRGSKPRLLYGPERYRYLQQSIAEVSKAYPKVGLLDQRSSSFLLDEIDWIKSCNYTTLTEYQNADRLGRMNRQSEQPQRLIKNSETRAAIYELMQTYDRQLAKAGLIDNKSLTLLVLRHLKRKPQPTYSHILVDETQDLTRVQLEFLQLLYKPREHSSFTFIADTAQSIYTHSWLVRGRSFASIGFDMKGKSNVLSKNYRTTTQIAEAAYSLIESDPSIIDDENYVRPALIDRQGSYPTYKRFASGQQEAEFVCREIKDKLLLQHNYGDIMIQARLRRQLDQVAEVLAQHDIPFQFLRDDEVSFADDKVGLSTIHSMKGLESKVVFIVGLNANTMPLLSYQDKEDQESQEITEKKLFYVGMTRASERLYLSSSHKPSKFLQDINPHLLRINSSTRFRAFKKVNLADYLFTSDLPNMYSLEEQVRQWVLRELQESYKYPLKLLSVEHKVSCFSRMGSVDICVSIYQNNQLVPFLYVETKAPGSDLTAGLKQLKSYMAACKSVRYGVVTDGNDLIVINDSEQQVEDIPCFSHTMLPSSMEDFSFNCLRRNRSFKLTRDADLPGELAVQESGQTVEYSQADLQRVPLYRSIAAGQPVYMDERSEACFELPREWLTDECYLLRVQGDSMIEADICHDDYVLVQRQDTATNRDIVVVALDDEATLKRYMKMGNTVLLIPENERYEPIQLSDNQARILGIAIGVIRRQRDG